MITRKEFDKSVEEITDKMKFISEGLESLWQWIQTARMNCDDENTRSILNSIQDRVEAVQFNGYSNPDMMANKMRFKDFYSVLDENESAKNLDRLLTLEKFAESVKNSVKNFDI